MGLHVVGRGRDSRAQNGLIRRCKMHVGATPPAPGAIAGLEHRGRLLEERALLRGRELHHPPVVVRRAKRSENLPVKAKVGMLHVRLLHGSRNLQRHLAKVVSGHVQSDSLLFILFCRAVVDPLQCQIEWLRMETDFARGLVAVEAQARGFIPSNVCGASKRMARAMARASARTYWPCSIFSASTRASWRRTIRALA